VDVTTRQLASILALQLPRAASPLPRWKRQAYADPLVVGGVPAEIAALTEEELRRLIARHPDLGRLADAPEPDGTAMRDRLAAVLQLEPDATGRLRSLFVPLPKGILRAAEHGRRRRWRVGLAGHGALLAVILAVVIAPPLLGFHYAADERWAWARIFGVVVYAAFPAFLFARFVRYRADSLWTDFVLNLHRLDMDSPQHLPEPLMNSVYYEPWLEHGGARYANTRSIYEYKFESVYGVGSTCAHHARMLRVVEVLPVYLFTLLLAVCWTFVLSGSAPMTAPARYLTTEQAVSLGFLGAYAFSVQALIRRYFQSDLRPAAFTGLIQRFLFVLIGAYAVHEAVGARLDAHTEVALLFLVGFFPTTVVQILRILTAKVLRGVGVPNMNSDFPLSELDGMTIWVEARLLEIGVEDMQNLSTGSRWRGWSTGSTSRSSTCTCPRRRLSSRAMPAGTRCRGCGTCSGCTASARPPISRTPSRRDTRRRPWPPSAGMCRPPRGWLRAAPRRWSGSSRPPCGTSRTCSTSGRGRRARRPPSRR
jgi:hypothetical protein